MKHKPMGAGRTILKRFPSFCIYVDEQRKILLKTVDAFAIGNYEWMVLYR